MNDAKPAAHPHWEPDSSHPRPGTVWRSSLICQEEEGLLADLNRVFNQQELFALELTSGELSTIAEEAYAWRLIDVGEQLLRHARNRAQEG